MIRVSRIIVLTAFLLAGFGLPATFAQSGRDAEDYMKAIKKAIPAGATQQIIALLGDLGPVNNKKSVKFLFSIAVQIEGMGQVFHDVNDRMDIFDAIEASLGATEDDRGIDAILAAATRKARKPADLNSRVLALRAATSTEWDGVDEALIKAVGDRNEQVALHGVQGLAERETIGGVDALIDALQSQERGKGRLYWEIQDALGAITGQSFDDARGWKAYWKVKGRNFDREAESHRETGGARGARGTTTNRGPKLFGGTEVTSRRVVFIVDVSGSMHIKDPVVGGEAGSTGPGGADPNQPEACPECGETHPGVSLPEERRRITRVIDEFTKLVKALPDGTMFNLVKFSSEAQSFKDHHLVQASGKTRQEAIHFVEGLKAEGSTNAYAALEEAFANEQADTIYFLTDGTPMPPGAGGAVSNQQLQAEIERILGMVREKNRFRQLKIHCLGFRGSDPSMLRQLCEIGNHGEYTDIQ